MQEFYIINLLILYEHKVENSVGMSLKLDTIMILRDQFLESFCANLRSILRRNTEMVSASRQFVE